jgi:hypothetical protein
MRATAPLLVLRFRSSHHFAATSHANFGNIRSTSNFMILVRFMNLKFLQWTRRETGRNFKFTALVLLMAGLAGAPAAAQTPKSTKAPAGPDVRYFTYLSGLMEDRADVVLKETRQAGRLVAANLDVCFPVPSDPNRTDRFMLTLAVEGDKLSGSTTSQESNLPVSVSLTRKPNGKAFDFTGRISVGTTASAIASTETTDLSEKEFREQQTAEDTITPAPPDFTEVSPEAISVKVKRDGVVDFVKSLRGENIQMALYGLIASCAELRSGEQVLRLTVDPERAPAVIEKLRTQPGVVTVGWTEGNMDMERTVRFPAAEWREAGKINREKLAAAVAKALAASLPATFVSSNWNSLTGELKVALKRPSAVLPALGLTENIEVTLLVSPDKPGASDHLLLWAGSPSVETLDENSDPKLNLVENSSGNDEESLSLNDEQTLAALAKEFRAQLWDSEKSVWK